MNDILLEIADLCVQDQQRNILKNIYLTVKKGRILMIIGESGSGKSTLLKTIIGLNNKKLMVKAEKVNYKNKDLLTLSDRQWQMIRGQEIAIVQQDAEAAFCPVQKIIVQLWQMVKQHFDWTYEKMLMEVSKIMQKLHLPKAVLQQYPFELSGGLAQRVGLLSAFILKPSLLLLDEPTSALDTITQKEVLDEIAHLRNKDMGIIMVTHNIKIARMMADNLIVLQNGIIVEQGNCKKILAAPQHPYSQKLLAAVPSLK